jgi:hypothetical protein
MTQLKGLEELQQFKLTKREVADFLGISTNAVRMSQRGKNCHNLEYRFNGKQFLFKVPRRDMVITKIPDHPLDHPGTPRSTPGATLGKHKKTYNRGATARGEANYTSMALQMHNEAKMRVALDKKFKNEAHKKAFMDMSEAGFKEALEISKRAESKKFQENTRVTPEVFPGGSPNSIHQSHGKYGTMLNAQGIAEGDRKALEREDRKFEDETGTKFKQEYQNKMQLDGTVRRELVKTNTIDFTPSKPFQSTGCYWESDYDRKEKEGGVEITQYQIDKATPIEERTSFDSKVEEDIYRAKKHLLKTKGTWD